MFAAYISLKQIICLGFACQHVCFKLEGESDNIKMLKKCVLKVCKKSIGVNNIELPNAMESICQHMHTHEHIER